MYNYFPHSSAMRTADDVLTLRMTEGSAGYGIYCMVLELLRDSDSRSLSANPKNLAFALNEPDVALVERVLKSPGLFSIGEDGRFTSPWLEKVMAEFDAKRTAAQEAGRRGAAARYGTKEVVNKVPNSDPMGGAMAPPKATDSNTPIQEEEKNERKPTKTPTNSRSRLYELSWKEYGGEELFRLARGAKTDLGDTQYEDAINACDVYKGRGINYHDPVFIFNACKTLGLSAEMYDFLVKLTIYGSNQQATTRRLREIVSAWTTTDRERRFRPKYPADYVLTQLIPLA